MEALRSVSDILELTCKVELNMLEVLLRHRQHIAGVGKEHISAVLVFCHILVFALLEVFEFCRVVAFHPASLVQMYRLPATLGVVFVLQSVLYHLELQLTYSSDNLSSVELVYEHLCHTLVHELVDTFVELFALHRIVVLYILEHLRRE